MPRVWVDNRAARARQRARYGEIEELSPHMPAFVVEDFYTYQAHAPGAA